MGQIKVTMPENASQVEVDEKREMERKPIVKNEILSDMESLQHYVPKQTNALLETKLTKYG